MPSNSKNIYCPNNGSYPYKLEVSFSESSASVANNTSVISITGSISASNVGFNEVNDCPLIIKWYDNKRATTTEVKRVSVHKVGYNSGGPNKVSVSGSITVPHNSDGSLSGYATVSFTKHAWASGWVPGSNSVSTSNTALTTIARASSITSVKSTNGLLGDNVTVSINRKSSSFTHIVWYKFNNGGWVKLTETAATSYTFTAPLSLANSIPNNTTGTLYVSIRTMNGGTAIGSDVTTSITLTVPASVKPSIGSVTATRVNNGVPDAWGLYLRGISQVKVSMGGITGAYSSTIKSYSISGHALSSASSSATSNVLTNTGSQTYTCKIVDSRGRSATKTVSISVIDYYSPSITIRADRCDSKGSISSDGTSLRVIVDYSIASASGKNSIKSKSVSCNGVSNTTFEDNVSFILNANCSTSSTYVVVASVTDQLGNTVQISANIPTAYRIMNVRSDKKGIAFGGFSQKDAMEVFMDAHFYGKVFINNVSLDEILDSIVLYK